MCVSSFSLKQPECEPQNDEQPDQQPREKLPPVLPLNRRCLGSSWLKIRVRRHRRTIRWPGFQGRRIGQTARRDFCETNVGRVPGERNDHLSQSRRSVLSDLLLPSLRRQQMQTAVPLLFLNPWRLLRTQPDHFRTRQFSDLYQFLTKRFL